MSMIENLRSAGPGRQIALVSLVAVVIMAVLVAVYFAAFHSPYQVLFTNLRTMDAAAIVAELDKKKVPYRLKDGGATILAPAKLVDSTRLSIMSEDLPLKGVVGFELFNKSDMGLTEFAQKINYRRALQGELARTIMALDTIDSARVHLTLTDPTVFRDDRRPSKASVTLIPRAGKLIAAGTVRGVERLVAAAVPDLEPADVVILDEHGLVVSGDRSASTASAAPGDQEREAIERYYAARIKRALQSLSPDQPFDVSVSAAVPTSPPTITPVSDQAAFETWSPDARSFQLSVMIAGAPADPGAQDRVRRTVATAIGLDAALGDTVQISSSPGALVVAEPLSVAPPIAAPLQAPGLAHPEMGLPPSQFWMVVLIPVLGLLLFAAYLLHRRRPASRSLTADQRSEYAQRLRLLLDQEDARATSHS